MILSPDSIFSGTALAQKKKKKKPHLHHANGTARPE
jgi:hypothetical protein